MGRSSKGRFVKEDFVPASDMERFMNRRNVKLVFGADALVEARERVETGLEMELSGDQEWGGVKWVLYGGLFQPANLADAPSAGENFHIQCQLQDRYDAVLADAVLLDRDDPEVLANVIITIDQSTEGAGPMVFPVAMDVVHPLPILSKDIQLVMQAVDNAAFNTKRWVASLFWAIHPMSPGDVAALVQATARND